MNEIAIYIFLMVASLAFWLWEMWYSRKESKMKADDLGDKLEDVLERHCYDEYSVFTMNCLKLNKDCAGVLKSLRPGDQVSLQRRFDGVRIYYDVFALGRLIGCLGDQSSEVIDIIVSDYRIRGSYVWARENNAKDTDNISIIVCYNREAKSVSATIDTNDDSNLFLSSKGTTLSFELN